MSEKKNDCLSFMNLVTEADKSWFINETWNAVFQMNRNNFEAVYIDYPRAFFGTGAQYKWLAKWKNRFVCVPYSSIFPIYVIDGKNKHFTVALPQNGRCCEYLLRTVVQRERYLYLFTNDTKISVVKYDLETGEVERIFDWSGNAISREISFKLGRVSCYQGSFWSTVIGTAYILEIACDTFEIKLHKNEKDVCYGWFLEMNQKCYYALGNIGKNKCIIRGRKPNDQDGQELFEITDYMKDNEYDDVRMEKDMVWLFPHGEGNILKICLSMGKCTEINYPLGFSWIQDRRYHSKIRFTCIEEIGSRWILYPRTGNGILLLDKYTDVMDYQPLEVDMREIMRAQAMDVKIENVSVMEDGLFFLLGLLDRKKCNSDK